MIDFSFEFQYAEETSPTLRQTEGHISKGRCVVLCGGSGCGKSTLLRCMNGLIPQFYEGELKGFCRLNGRDTEGLSIGEIGELAASVFQDPRSQFFTVNSSNEVAFGLENHCLPQEQIRQRVDEAFRVFHLERLQDRNVYELSSGERQLISILSAWAMDADIFLLDEPTANLDHAATQQLKTILLALKQQGKTLLLSEHRLYYLVDIADEYWVMENGAIRTKYTAEEALALSPEQLRALSLRPLDLTKITVPEKPVIPKDSPSALSVSNVRYAYGKNADATLSDVSFTVREHEIVGLVGANGCGKTTIGKVIAGLYRPNGGKIALYGKLLKPKQLQKQVLFIMQEAEFQFFTNSVLHELQYGHAVTPDFDKKAEMLLKNMGMYLLLLICEKAFRLDFRFIWPFFKTFDAARLGQFCVYIPVFALFFILNNSKIMASSRCNAAYKPGFAGFMGCWWRNALMMVGGVLIIVLLEYIPFFMNIAPGADLLFGSTFGGPFMSLLILFVPQVLVFSIICTYTYRRTGNVYTGALTVASLACWIVTGGSSML